MSGLTPEEREAQHPFYLTVAHRHGDERVCLYNAASGTWYVEGGPGSGRTRPICDREHPDPAAHEAAAAEQARAEGIRLALYEIGYWCGECAVTDDDCCEWPATLRAALATEPTP